MGQLTDRQVTILYGFVAAVLSLALCAMSLVELRQIRVVEADRDQARNALDRIQERLDARPQIVEQIEARTHELDRLRAIAPPLGPASADALAELADARKQLGLPPLRYTRDRSDHTDGLWPELGEAPVPLLHPRLTPVTWYVTFDATYWQLTRLLNRIERWARLALVSELVVQRLEGEVPGSIRLRVGLALTVYGHRGEGDGPAVTDAERAELLRQLGRAKAHALAPATRKGDDGWYARGVDWRGKDGLPARNPFDPFAGLTRAK